MSSAASYRSETHQAMIGPQPFTVIELIPIFSSEEDREQVKQNIEYGLYRIFEKYSQN